MHANMTMIRYTLGCRCFWSVLERTGKKIIAISSPEFQAFGLSIGGVNMELHRKKWKSWQDFGEAV